LLALHPQLQAEQFLRADPEFTVSEFVVEKNKNRRSKEMSNTISKMIVAAAVAATVSVQADARTHSRAIIVVSSSDLPEMAQGNSEAMYLHYMGDGAILYLEQDHGRTLAIVDVSDAAAMRGIARVSVDAASPYDFVGTLRDSTVLIRYRDDSGFAIIDLKHFKKPLLTEAPRFQHPARAEALGNNGLMLVATTGPSARAEDPQYEILDISNPSQPAVLGTVEGVQQRLERSETGTLFLLGKSGLTVVRQPSLEIRLLREVPSDLLIQSSEPTRCAAQRAASEGTAAPGRGSRFGPPIAPIDFQCKNAHLHQTQGGDCSIASDSNDLGL
jgi:LVIVD repeat